MATRRRIIIVGSSGQGKSSTGNSLLGKDLFETGDGAGGTTFENQSHQHVFNGVTYEIVDTVGLSEARQGAAVSPLRALYNFFHLILSAGRGDGISLVLLVMKKGTILDTFKRNYRLFVEMLGRNQIPVIAVITNCDSVADRGWPGDDETKKMFRAEKMEFKDMQWFCAGKWTDPEWEKLVAKQKAMCREELWEKIARHALAQPILIDHTPDDRGSFRQYWNGFVQSLPIRSAKWLMKPEGKLSAMFEKAGNDPVVREMWLAWQFALKTEVRV